MQKEVAIRSRVKLACVMIILFSFFSRSVPSFAIKKFFLSPISISPLSLSLSLSLSGMLVLFIVLMSVEAEDLDPVVNLVYTESEVNKRC